MAVLSDIRGALETRLAAMSPNWPTAFENVSFDKPSDGSYQKATMLPAQSVGFAGRGSQTKYHGLLNVMVVMAANGSGIGGAEARASLILAQFPQGSSFTNGSATVTIGQPPYVAKATQTEDEISIPVWIPWFCYI